MDWNDHASTWDDDPAVRAYAEAVFETLIPRVEARGLNLADCKVLDFGCGTGVLTEKLAEQCREVVGLDPAERMVDVLGAKIDARGWKHVRTLVGTLESVRKSQPGALGSGFDLVACSSVCAFVPDYPGTVHGLVDLLRTGGVFAQFDWERDDKEDEPFGFARAEIEQTLRAGGLEDVESGVAFERAIGDQVMRPLIGIGTKR